MVSKQERPYRDRDWLREKVVDEDLTDPEIADVAEVTSETIFRWRHKFGIERVPQGEATYRDEEWLRNRVSEGMTDEEIANEVDAGSSTITSWRENHGIPPTYAFRRPDPDEVKRLYFDEKMSFADIAKELGLSSHSQVQDCFERNGFEARRRGAAVSLSRGPHKMHTHHGYELFKPSSDEQAFVHKLAAVAWFGFGSVKNKQVHHWSGVPWDNREDNLSPLTASEHTALHNRDYYEHRESKPEAFRDGE